MTDSQNSSEATGRRGVRWTIPNAICVARILGSPLLVLLAVRGERIGLLMTFLALTLSDWLDGKLAVWLDQRSAIGPRLDSLADLSMYTSLSIGLFALDGGRLLSEWPWWTTALATYLLAGAAGLRKFRRWPSHHTGLAKVSWFLVLAGTSIFLLAPTDWLDIATDPGGSWPLRLALCVVTLGNFQSLAITSILPHWAEDVRTLADARRLRDQTS